MSERLFKTRYGYEKRQVSILTIFDILSMVKENFLKVGDKLTEEEIADLQKLHRQKKLGFDTVKIAKTIPFAPFMFLGVLLTYFLQGSLLYYLFRY